MGQEELYKEIIRVIKLSIHMGSKTLVQEIRTKYKETIHIKVRSKNLKCCKRKQMLNKAIKELFQLRVEKLVYE